MGFSISKIVKKIHPFIFSCLIVAPWLWSLSIGPWPELIPLVFSGIVFSLILLFKNLNDIPHLCATSWRLAACINIIPIAFQYFGFNISEWQWVIIPVTNPGYAKGLIGQPNLESTFILIGLVSTLFLSNKKNILPSAIICAWLGVGLALLSSRTGLIQILFLIFAVYFFKVSKKEFYFLIFIFFVGYVFASLILPVVSKELGIETQRNIFDRLDGTINCGSRLYLWGNVLELIKQKPLMGWGWGNLRFAQYQTIFLTPRFCEVLGNAHNLPLHLAVSFGIPVAIGICALLGWWIYKSKPLNQNDCWKIMAWWIVFIILIHSMLEFPLWYGPFQIVVFLCCLIISGKEKIFNKQRINLFISPIVMLFFCFLGYDYLKASQPYIPENYRFPAIKGEKNLTKVVDYSLDNFFFKKEALFAKLMVLDLSRQNASLINKISEYLLSYSPEPSVIAKLIESSEIIGDNEKAELHMKLFALAFPEKFEEWSSNRKIGKGLIISPISSSP